MHAAMLAVIRSYLDGNLSVDQLMGWVILNLRRVSAFTDSPTATLLGQLYIALVEFDAGPITEETLRERLADLYHRSAPPPLYDRNGHLIDHAC